MSGRTYIVTGANSGSGLATTEQLARQGAHVVAACRRVVSGEDAIRHLAGVRGSVQVRELDLGSLASVRRFASEFRAEHEKIHGLVNNAGVMNTPKGRTEDGFETQLGVNYLGHFLLTELLLDTSKASAPSHSGEYYSQQSILYADKANRRGGWPMRSPNPLVFDDALAEQLYEESVKLVGL